VRLGEPETFGVTGRKSFLPNPSSTKFARRRPQSAKSGTKGVPALSQAAIDSKEQVKYLERSFRWSELSCWPLFRTRNLTTVLLVAAFARRTSYHAHPSARSQQSAGGIELPKSGQINWRLRAIFCWAEWPFRPRFRYLVQQTLQQKIKSS